MKTESEWTSKSGHAHTHTHTHFIFHLISLYMRYKVIRIRDFRVCVKLQDEGQKVTAGM